MQALENDDVEHIDLREENAGSNAGARASVGGLRMQNFQGERNRNRDNSREDRVTVLSQDNHPDIVRGKAPSQHPYFGQEENWNDYESLDRTNNTNT